MSALRWSLAVSHSLRRSELHAHAAALGRCSLLCRPEQGWRQCAQSQVLQQGLCWFRLLVHGQTGHHSVIRDRLWEHCKSEGSMLVRNY